MTQPSEQATRLANEIAIRVDAGAIPERRGVLLAGYVLLRSAGVECTSSIERRRRRWLRKYGLPEGSYG